MQQSALFHDSIYDALGADIALIGGVKKVAGMLWPSLDPSMAATRLRACLNPEHAQKFGPDEVLQIKRWAREAGSTATIQYEAQQLGYRIECVEPEDELEQLERENNELLKALSRRMERLEMLRTKLRAVGK